MADLTELESAQTIKIVGSSVVGSEQTPVSSSNEGELRTSDITLTAGLDSVVSIGAGVSVELKVGGTPKSNRKYIQIQAKDKDVKWGFSSGSESFDAFKNQFILLPYGADTSIFLKNTGTSSADVAIAEV